MTIPKWLRSLFNVSEPVLTESPAERKPLTIKEKKVRKIKRVARKNARRNNRS